MTWPDLALAIVAIGVALIAWTIVRHENRKR